MVINIWLSYQVRFLVGITSKLTINQSHVFSVSFKGAIHYLPFAGRFAGTIISARIYTSLEAINALSPRDKFALVKESFSLTGAQDSSCSSIGEQNPMLFAEKPANRTREMLKQLTDLTSDLNTRSAKRGGG